MTVTTTPANSKTFPATKNPRFYIAFVDATGASEAKFPIGPSFFTVSQGQINLTHGFEKVALVDIGNTGNGYEPRQVVVLELNGNTGTMSYYDTATNEHVVERGAVNPDGDFDAIAVDQRLPVAARLATPVIQARLDLLNRALR